MFGFIRAVGFDQGFEVDARREAFLDGVKGLPQQGFGFFLHLCKPCLPTGERSLVRAVILGAQVLQFVQVLHLRGRHGQLLERRAQGRHGAGQLLFLRLRGLGRLLRIIQRDLPDVAVSLGNIEGLAVGRDDLLLKQRHVVAIALPLRRDESLLIVGVHLLPGDGHIRAEHLYGPVVALGDHKLVVDGLDGIALSLHDGSDVLLGDLLTALQHSLVQDLPELLILALRGSLEQFLFRLGEAVLPRLGQLVLDQAHVDELVDDGVNTCLQILRFDGRVGQKAGHVQRGIQG